MDKRDECKRSADEASKQIYDDTKTRVSPVSWEQHGRSLLTGHVLLITLPLVVLVTGWLALLRGWGDVSRVPHPMRKRLNGVSADRAMLFVAVLTLMAGFVLAIVA